MNWALARQRGWRLVLRIEDLDTPRVKPETVALTTDLLAWLGLEWDGPTTIQSQNLEPYRDAMERLARAGLTYPSAHTRGQLEDLAASAALGAPQEGVTEAHFPASLRPLERPPGFDNPLTNWRFTTPAHPVAFVDAFAGPQAFDVERLVGDFTIWTKRGCPAYQLAVVVDDARQGVTHIVRGDDLLDSAARQLLLYRALGLTPEPTHIHLPLVRGADGKRLAKRHGDTRLDVYRQRGVGPERVIGLVAEWCGLGARRPMSAAEFRDRFDLARVPLEPITFTPEDDSWLLAGLS